MADKMSLCARAESNQIARSGFIRLPGTALHFWYLMDCMRTEYCCRLPRRMEYFTMPPTTSVSHVLYQPCSVPAMFCTWLCRNPDLCSSKSVVIVHPRGGLLTLFVIKDHGSESLALRTCLRWVMNAFPHLLQLNSGKIQLTSICTPFFVIEAFSCIAKRPPSSSKSLWVITPVLGALLSA